MRVRALQKVSYDRRERFPGDVYSMHDRESSEVKVLVALGKIEVVDKDPDPVPAPKYSTTALLAQDEQPQATDKVESQSTENSPLVSPRRYQRRDMRARR